MNTNKPTVGRLAVLATSAILAAALVLMPGTAHAGLIHEYTFDGTTVTDSTGGANGALLNGASVSGGVLNLDGVNDFVQFGSMIVPTGLTAFSVTMDAQQLSTQTIFVELISQSRSFGPGFYIGQKPDGTFRFGDQLQNTGVLFPTDGAFHSFALTSDVTGTRFFIDGAQVFATGLQISIGSTGTNTRLGRQFESNSEFFHGKLDNVRIYDSALTAAQVAALAIPEPGTLALFGFGLAGLGVLRRRRRLLT